MSNKNKSATIYDVAKEASVSLATASRVINNVNKVSEDTKQRVLDAIKKLNYHPNSMAVELASRKNTNVAIVVPELNYTYISHVVAGLMEKANEYGYDCLIFTTKNNKQDFSSTIDKVLSLRPNGIIVFNDNLKDEELKEMVTFDIPVVTLGIDLKTISSVAWHYKNQIIDIVKEALHRKKEVYFLSVADSGRIEQRVLNGIESAYQMEGKIFKNIICVPDSYKETYKIVSEKITEMDSAFFIATRDSICLAALNAALDANKKVPNDFEFMAMLGTKYSELSRPKLSSLSINMKKLGIEGMKVLADIINNPGNIITEKLSFKYEKRGSTL